MWSVFCHVGWLVCTSHSCSSSAASSACGWKACRSVSCLSSCRRPTSCWNCVLTSTWYVSAASWEWRRSCSLSCCSSTALQRHSSRSPSRRSTENLMDIDWSGHMCLQLLCVHKFSSDVGICSCKQPVVNCRVLMQYVYISTDIKTFMFALLHCESKKLCQTDFYSNFFNLHWSLMLFCSEMICAQYCWGNSHNTLPELSPYHVNLSTFDVSTNLLCKHGFCNDSVFFWA